MWLKNVWYVAGFEAELEDSAVIARRFLDTPVVMYRTSSGQLAALEDLCPHRLMPLSAGKRVGDQLQCGYHGMRFGPDGVCTEAPGQARPSDKACITSYPLQARHGLRWIWMGKPHLAKPDLIPDVHWYQDPAWVPSDGYHLIQADLRLLNDNLLDLSHESYVHTRTIGNEEEESIANFPLEVTVEGDRLVRAHREMPNIDPPPFFAMILDHKGRIDRWQTAINLAPGINMTDVGVYPVGTPRKDAFVGHVLHLLTPETDHSTHYFWSMTRNYRLDNAPLTQAIRDAVNLTFDEDREVLEVQQAQIARLGGAIPRVALRLDEAPLRARRLLAALVEREQADPDYVMEPLPLIDDRYLQG